MTASFICLLSLVAPRAAKHRCRIPHLSAAITLSVCPACLLYLHFCLFKRHARSSSLYVYVRMCARTREKVVAYRQRRLSRQLCMYKSTRQDCQKAPVNTRQYRVQAPAHEREKDVLSRLAWKALHCGVYTRTQKRQTVRQSFSLIKSMHICAHTREKSYIYCSYYCFLPSAYFGMPLYRTSLFLHTVSAF